MVPDAHAPALAPPSSADVDQQLKTAQQIFDTVLKADEHQDNKASRILGAVAFLLAASGAALTFTLPTAAKIEDRVKALSGAEYLTYFHPGLISFAILLVSLLVGVSFYLLALGPSFNWHRNNQQQDLNDPASTLLFFEEVGKQSGATLKEFIRSSTSDSLKERLITNLTHEAVLIAQKTKRKVGFMERGSLFFRYGISWGIPLILSVFSTEKWWSILTFALALFLPEILRRFFSGPRTS